MLSKDGYRYEISNKQIRIWLGIQGLDEPPVLFQDVKPNTGEPFASDEEATEWAEDFITQATISSNIPIEESLPTDEPVAE